MQALKLNSLTYEFKYSKSEEIRLFKCSDIHFDNPKCRRDLFFNHLKRAQDKGAKVLINGDLFCVMQGKYDPRRNKKDIRPEHNVPHYIDAVIDDTVDQLSPYADVLAFISEGNHETAILKNLETDVTARFVDKFNERNKTKLLKGGYRGWILIRKEVGKGIFLCYKIYYNHGYGGGGEMTYGTLQHSRANMYIENADAIWMGHVHDMYALPTKTEGFDNSPNAYRPKERTIYNIRTSTYKEEFDDCPGGFHIERGRKPKPLGGVFLELDMVRVEKDSKKLHPTYSIWAE